MRNKRGFTMLEMVAAISVLSLLVLLALPFAKITMPENYLFAYDYLKTQAQSMRTEQAALMQPQGSQSYLNSTIRFNQRGHVNQAQTVTFYSNGRWREMVIELGGGRLVEK